MERTSGPSGSHTLRTIVVDDDEAVAALHGRFVELHPAFAVVAIAHSGPEAQALIAEFEPDVVLLDFHLPGLSGLDVLRSVRANGRYQPEVIAVTAARDVDSVRQARSAGVQHYLVKPFTAQNLKTRLDDVVRDRFALMKSAASDGLVQHDIDALLRGGRLTREALPKGLSNETLAAVASALESAPGSTAGELAEHAGVSRVSTRRYLEFLVADGRAAKALDYTTAGRPSTRYRARN